MSSLHLALVAVVAIAAATFGVTLRAGLRAIAARERLRQPMPPAWIAGGRGPRRQRSWAAVPAVIAAFAFTCVAIMVLCFCGVVWVLLAG